MLRWEAISGRGGERSFEGNGVSPRITRQTDRRQHRSNSGSPRANRMVKQTYTSTLIFREQDRDGVGTGR